MLDLIKLYKAQFKPVMKEIIIKDKVQYLEDNYPFDDVPKLDEEKFCIHCEEIIWVKDYKVFADEDGDEYICCPNAPECDGTVIDWFEVDDTHRKK